MTEKLKKELGLLDVFCIATGAMISSGLFILPGMAFAKAGPGVVFLSSRRAALYPHAFEYGRAVNGYA